MVYPGIHSGKLNVLNYIDAMMLNASVMADARNSVRFIRNLGQYPVTVRTSVTNALGMTSPVRGTAIRLVMMKYFGNVPK